MFATISTPSHMTIESQSQGPWDREATVWSHRGGSVTISHRHFWRSASRCDEPKKTLKEAI